MTAILWIISSQTPTEEKVCKKMKDIDVDIYMYGKILDY
jgi:hypothetical protein